MLQTVRAIVKKGKIKLLEDMSFPEGVEVVVTMLPKNNDRFWLDASTQALNEVWDNPEDDIYAQLLQE